MDAVTYLKTYERMRETEGLAPFERLFNEETTPEQRVELIEEWGRENPEKSTRITEEEARAIRESLEDVTAQLFDLQSQMMDLEFEIIDIKGRFL